MPRREFIRSFKKKLYDGLYRVNRFAGNRGFYRATISTWGEKLVFVRIAAAAIRNDRFNIECEKNLRNTQLKEFNEGESAEAFRSMASRLFLWK